MTTTILDPPSGRGPHVCLCACPRREHLGEDGKRHARRCGCGEFRPDMRPVRGSQEHQRGEEAG